MAPKPELRRLPGKVAIVTGATSGIGEMTARRFVSEGASVVLCGRNRAAGQSLVDELGAQRTDLVLGEGSEEATAAAAIAAASRFGPLDILVNNAAMDFTSDLLTTEVADVRRVLEVNFIGPFVMLQAAARAMRGRGGSIVNVGSRLATIGVRTMSVYGAAKGALTSFTRGAAIDLAADGIRVNTVAPGFTETPLMAAWLAGQPDPEAVRQRTVSQIPQGRFATPNDVVAAILFLASDEAAHVTGALLAVDGGYTAA
jgi:NAD(P)-dependent dehydrogenase (short-subunit alcohol dehydrogenase family)